METNPTNSENSTPEFRPFYVRIFSKRALRVYIFVLVALVTLIALYHAEENWRGAHAWNRYKHERSVLGDSMDWRKIIPPRVPDDQNFTMTPFLAPMFDFEPGTQIARDTNAAAQHRDFAKDFPTGWNWTNEIDVLSLANFLLDPKETNAQPKITDRKEAARIILQKTEQYTPVLEEFRRASARPYARFNIAYEIPDKVSIMLPHLYLTRNTCRVLAIRSTAELALGENDQAFADVKLGLYLAEAVKAEPMIISQLVRQANVRVTLASIVTGLREKHWSDAQLQELQAILEKIDLIGGLQVSLEGESVMHSTVLEDLKATPNRLKVIRRWGGLINSGTDANSRNPLLEFLFWVAVPRGWIDFEQLNYRQFYLDKVAIAVDTKNQSIDPQIPAEADKASEKLASTGLLEKTLKHNVIIALAMPTFGKLAQKTAVAQAYVKMAEVACALERYRSANGQYPDALSALTPQFVTTLPNDPIKGGQFKYRRTGDAFLLYSIGWNAIDDGGKTVMGKGRTSHANAAEGDWVWGGASNY